MRTLYPELEPFNSGFLKVSDLHNLYFEESGNPKGSPVIFLHGGPGGGTDSQNRQYFDPQHYRIILLDQRGAGKSEPHAELEENNTWNLVQDIETLREHLSIDKWHVFGGSWGSTLSLAYSITHPDKVISLTLRGIFLCRPKEIKWFYQEGASKIFPDKWDKYIEVIPEDERHDLVSAFYKRLTGDNEEEKIKAARAWSQWEGSTSKLLPPKKLMHDFESDYFMLAFARIECHYFTNNAFFETDNYLIENIDKIRHIPCEIVHGRYDVVCPIENAWELKKAFPEANLIIAHNSGHSATEDEIIHHLVEITDRFKVL